MGKLSSTIGALGKAAKGTAKRVSKSKVVRKTAIAGKKAVRGAKKGVAGAQVKGSKFLQKSVAKIKPIAADLKQGGIRKINKLVETKTQNLIPKLTNKIEEKVNSFDPNKFLGKIFDGGLNSLKSFGSNLDGMKGRFDSTVEFLGKANELASKFVKKLATAKPGKKSGGGSLFGKLIKGVAIAGAAALGTAVVAKVAVTGGIRKGAKNLLKKGIDFVRSRKQKKLEKKQAEAKVKKDKGNANIFKSILDKFSSVLDFTPKSIKKFKSEGKDNYKSKFGGGEESSEDFRFRRFTNKNGDKKVHDLKVSYKGGENVSGSGDDEVTKRIIKVKKEIMELEEDYSDNRMMGKRDDDDKAAAKEMLKKIRALEKELTELIPLAKGTTTVEGNRKNVNEVMKDPAFAEEGKAGKDGKDGKSKPGQIFNNIKNTFGGVKEKAGNFLKGVGKALKPKPSGEKNTRKNSRIKSGETISKDPISFADDTIQQAEQVKPNPQQSAAKKEMAGGVSTSARTPSTPSGGGGGEVIPVELPPSGGKGGLPSPKPSDKMKRASIKPANKVPSLLAIDTKNMHVLHAKSVYNIVDAL